LISGFPVPRLRKEKQSRKMLTMGKKRKKLDELSQAKLVYSIELGVFSLIFLTMGLLFYFEVIPMSDRRITIFSVITLVGGFLGVGDFVWFLCSPKRRKKNSMLDKASLLPVPLCLIPLDIVTFANGAFPDRAYSIMFFAVFLYFAVDYLVQLIYHWFRPIPMLLDTEEDPKEVERKDAETETNEKEEADRPKETPTEDPGDK
jgi:hypothetical protein